MITIKAENILLPINKYIELKREKIELVSNASIYDDAKRNNLRSVRTQYIYPIYIAVTFKQIRKCIIL